jgi:Protein of unknown function (DUF1588)/Protein of unknown function (DUF1592)/Protein of unknown function (DUF1595)/Protein of unknown function (DUF1585)/Protein of unknown function (DUF1587)
MGDSERQTRLLAISCLGMAACIGSIGDGDDDPDGDNPAIAQSGWSAPAMKRLTTTQYGNAIRDVFGSSVLLTKAIEEDETNEQFLSMGAAKVGTSEYGVELYHEAAIDIASQVVADAGNQPQLAGCAPFEPGDACISDALAHYATRLWRRPVQGEELAALTAIVGTPGQGTAEEWSYGMTFAIAAVVASPSFLYVPEVGELDESSGYYRYTGYEIASRLSLSLWNSIPDGELLDAAAAGRLSRRDGIRSEVARMLEAPRAQNLATRFFGESWLVSELDFTDKNTAIVPDWTPELVDAYLEEFDLVLRDMMQRDADVFELFTGTETFVNPLLASTYGMSETSSADFEQATLPSTRAGLLTSGALVSAISPSDRTSPTHRGKFILEQVLCTEVPPPPPSVDDVIEAPTVEEGLTLKEKLAQHREDPACAACHNLMDPLGFTFENFDAIGLYRETDNGSPVDASGELDGETIDGVHDLVDYVVADPRTTNCIAERLYTFATGHQAGGAEPAVIELVAEAFATQRSFKSLVTELLVSDAFRYLQPADDSAN